MSPVYWRPSYAGRRRRERAFARAELARQQAARDAAARRRAKRGPRPSLLGRLRAWLRWR